MNLDSSSAKKGEHLPKKNSLKLETHYFPTNWCLVSTKSEEDVSSPPPLIVSSPIPNLLKRRLSSAGAPDTSQTTRKIKSTESGGSKRVFTICSFQGPGGKNVRMNLFKLWVETKKKKKDIPPKKDQYGRPPECSFQRQCNVYIVFFFQCFVSFPLEALWWDKNS